mmetsp:Transcript_47780/g.79088  ORF Transcript_47780/g.79088 Transcript_47780/m.79088 type:complete len:88 (+) Transcript_47780:342-605(+)
MRIVTPHPTVLPPWPLLTRQALAPSPLDGAKTGTFEDDETGDSGVTAHWSPNSSIEPVQGGSMAKRAQFVGDATEDSEWRLEGGLKA